MSLFNQKMFDLNCEKGSYKKLKKKKLKFKGEIICKKEDILRRQRDWTKEEKLKGKDKIKFKESKANE